MVGLWLWRFVNKCWCVFNSITALWPPLWLPCMSTVYHLIIMHYVSPCHLSSQDVFCYFINNTALKIYFFLFFNPTSYLTPVFLPARPVLKKNLLPSSKVNSIYNVSINPLKTKHSICVYLFNSPENSIFCLKKELLFSFYCSPAQNLNKLLHE